MTPEDTGGPHQIPTRQPHWPSVVILAENAVHTVNILLSVAEVLLGKSIFESFSRLCGGGDTN
jgi:hypothetical protein